MLPIYTSFKTSPCTTSLHFHHTATNPAIKPYHPPSDAPQIQPATLPRPTKRATLPQSLQRATLPQSFRWANLLHPLLRATLPQTPMSATLQHSLQKANLPHTQQRATLLHLATTITLRQYLKRANLLQKLDRVRPALPIQNFRKRGNVPLRQMATSISALSHAARILLITKDGMGYRLQSLSPPQRLLT